MIFLKGKGEEFSPVLVVSSSHECEGAGVIGHGLGLCMWAKMSIGQWTVLSNIIEK